MKVRQDFVTNSSSSSFIIATKEDLTEGLLVKELQPLFGTISTDNMSVIQSIMKYLESTMSWNKDTSDFYFEDVPIEYFTNMDQAAAYYKPIKERVASSTYWTEEEACEGLPFMTKSITDGYKICKTYIDDYDDPNDSFLRTLGKEFNGDKIRIYVTGNYCY